MMELTTRIESGSTSWAYIIAFQILLHCHLITTFSTSHCFRSVFALRPHLILVTSKSFMASDAGVVCIATFVLDSNNVQFWVPVLTLGVGGNANTTDFDLGGHLIAAKSRLRIRTRANRPWSELQELYFRECSHLRRTEKLSSLAYRNISGKPNHIRSLLGDLMRTLTSVRPSDNFTFRQIQRWVISLLLQHVAWTNGLLTSREIWAGSSRVSDRPSLRIVSFASDQSWRFLDMDV